MSTVYRVYMNEYTLQGIYEWVQITGCIWMSIVYSVQVVYEWVHITECIRMSTDYRVYMNEYSLQSVYEWVILYVFWQAVGDTSFCMW